MFVPDGYVIAFITVFGAWGLGIMGILVQARRSLDNTLRDIDKRLIAVETIVTYFHPPSNYPPVQHTPPPNDAARQ